MLTFYYLTKSKQKNFMNAFHFGKQLDQCLDEDDDTNISVQQQMN